MTEPDAMADTSVCSPTLSIFSPFIPALIKQHIPPLSSTRYQPVREEASPASRSMPFCTGDTPRPSSAGSRQSTARNSEDLFGEVSISDDDSSNGSSRDALGIVLANQEMDSGLRWNRVNPALNLLRHAGFEAQQPQCDSRLVRALYLDAIAYLLAALPEDLTSEEIASLRRSLPENMKTALLPAPSKSNPNPPSHPNINSADPGSPETRSYLHRLLASSIVCFFLLLQFLLPFIKIVLLHLYQYERSLRVTERVAAITLYMADHVSKGSVSFGSAVLKMYEGKPGVAASSAASWWAEGIAGGIYEGVGEGMTILGFVGPDSRLERQRGINN